MNAAEVSRPAPPFTLPARFALAVAAAAHAAFVIAQWSRAYIDFGDGNYLYIATRIAEGAIVYRDILAPQPPAHLFLGALLVKLAGWAGLESPLYLVRGFSLLLHLATFLLVADLARRAWASSAAGVVAGVIYLLLPIGLWWSMAYQSEPLEIFFLVAMMEFAIRRGRRADVLTGIFGALAALTNATAAPFLLVLIVYMLARNPKRAAWIALPAIALAGAVTAALEIWTGGYFLQNAVFNQVGTYPKGNFIGYAFRKIANEGADILLLEGPFIVLAVMGLMRFLKETALEAEARDGLAWFGAATMASFLYVTKGGTVDYIYCLAEPALAIFGAGELIALWNLNQSAARESMTRAWSPLLLRLCLFAFLALVALGRPLVHYIRLWNQSAYELPDLAHAGVREDGTPGTNVEQVVRWIERYSKPGDTILTPPFYAFLAKRKIWEDYSELFIWRIKDHNDRLENNPQGEGWSKSRALADAIARRELSIVIIEMDQQGQLPEILSAIEQHYQSILPEGEFYRTLNTRLGIYIPKD
jgi:hypothetical protein